MELRSSFVVTRLDLMEEHWARHSVLRHEGRVGTDTPIGRDVDLGGAFVRLDWRSKQTIGCDALSCPAGFDVLADGAASVAISSMRRNEIYLLDDALRRRSTLSLPLFNDLHSVTRSRRGLLVTSTGLDAILEVSLGGELLWSWFAFEHGYETDQWHRRRVLDLSADHRLADYPTLTQTTHVNAAVESRSDDRYVYASLFHQGAIVRIDRTTGAAKTVVDGLRNCHSLRVYEGDDSRRYSVADTRGHRVIVFDAEFRAASTIPVASDWIADGQLTSDGTCIVADAASHAILEVDAGGRVLDQWRFDPLWRVYQAERVS